MTVSFHFVDETDSGCEPINKQTHTSPSLNWYPPALNVSTLDLVPRSRNLQILLTFQQSQIFPLESVLYFQWRRVVSEIALSADCFLSCLTLTSKLAPRHFWGQRETWHQRKMASTIGLWGEVVRLVVRMGPIKILSSLVWRITLVNTASPYRAVTLSGVACLDWGPAS